MNTLTTGIVSGIIGIFLVANGAMIIDDYPIWKIAWVNVIIVGLMFLMAAFVLIDKVEIKK